MTRCGTPVLALVALLASPPSLVAQERADTARVTVSGRVVDRYTRRGVRNALIQLPELGLSLFSDQDGGFTFSEIRRGVYRMVVRGAGYVASEGDFTVARSGSFELLLTPDQSPDAAALGKVIGRVLDTDSGEPLEGAIVSVPSLGQRRITDPGGWFDLGDLTAGAIVLQVSSLGYATRQDTVYVPAGQSVEIRIPLATEPIALEGITVTARSRFLESAGFFRRQGRGYNGRQWTVDEIQAANPIMLTDLVTRVLGVRWGRTRSGEMALLGRRQCRLSLYIDDMLVDDFSLDLLDPANVQALEVYHGNPTEMPVEYGFKHCGVILVWLKH